MSEPKRNHRFVVGYTHDGSAIYTLTERIKPMTLAEARTQLGRMQLDDPTIYELVPVKEGE